MTAAAPALTAECTGFWTQGGGDRLARPLLLAIAVALVLQFRLIFVQGVNWDEFLFLSKIYQFEQGMLPRALQTFYVRPLIWLTAVPGGEIAQIRVGRMIAFACELVTMAAIFAIGRRIALPSAAALAALAYLGAGFVFQHGASFRADPIAAALLMGATWIIACSRLRAPHMAGVAFLMALAGLVTVKSIFYAPVLAGLAWWRWRDSGLSRRMFLSFLAAAIAAIAIFGLLYAWHEAGLAKADIASSKAMMGNAYSHTMLAGLFPQLGFVQLFVARAPVATALILGALILCMMRRRANLPALTALGLAAPLATLAFYGNALPYFYAFILPPLFVLSAPLLALAIRRYGIVFPLLLVMANIAYLYLAMPKQVQERQSFLISHIQRMFPEPVPYFDACSMIASYPKDNVFMSAWGMENYRARGRPEFAQLIRERNPRFLIANHVAFGAALNGTPSDVRLLPEDEAAIRKHFRHYWGPVWIARDAKPTIAPPTGLPSEGSLFFDYPDDLFFGQRD